MVHSAADRLVQGFSAQDLEIVEEEKELDDDQDGGNDHSSVIHVVLNNEPNQKDWSNQEKNGSNQRDDLFQLVWREAEDVEDEQDNVDNDKDEVQAWSVSNTPFTEARTSTDPRSTKDSTDDEPNDDLSDLDHTSVGRQISRVNVGHFD